MAIAKSPSSTPSKMKQEAANSNPAARRVPDDTRGYIVAGFATVILLAGGLGGWAATTALSGAVIGAGTVVVDSNVKKVQHPTGGIVGEIKVREGAHVEAGDLVMRLDDTITRANLGIVISQLDELGIRQARLTAERDGANELVLPESMKARAALPDVQQLIASEATLLVSRRNSRTGQKAQLKERLNQLDEEIRGLKSQHGAKTREYQLILIELKEIEKLWEKNLAPLSKRIALNREATRVDGEAAHLISSMAQARAKIAETQLQLIQVDNDLRTEVTKELREVQSKQAELLERRIAADDQLKRVDLRSPQSGIVHQLTVHTIGGVINAGEPVMLIVPHNEALVLDVKIGLQDISQVTLGQEAFVRLTSFNQRTTPEIKGTVSRLPGDLTREQQSNQNYFMVRVVMSAEEIAKLGDQKLMSGMPAEVYLQTEARSALSYLIRPLTDQIARAFKER